MNKSICLILFSLVILSASTDSYDYYGKSSADLWLSREYEKQIVGDNFYGLRPRCYGGSGDYQYKYSRLPSGWKLYNDFDFPENRRSYFKNSIFVPISARNGKYQLGVSVYDMQYKVDVTNYLMIDKRGNDLSYYVRDSYDDSFKPVYYDDKYDYDSNYDNGYGYDDYGYDYGYGAGGVFEYPSWGRIETLIGDGDIAEIRAYVYGVIRSKKECYYRKEFLNGILSRIHRYIATSNDRLDDLQKGLRILERDLDDYQQKLYTLLRNRNYYKLDYFDSRYFLDYRYRYGDYSSEQDIYKLRILISNVVTAIKKQENQIIYTRRAIYDLENELSKVTVIIEKFIYDCRDVRILDYNYGGDNFFGYLPANNFYNYMEKTYGTRDIPYLPSYNDRVQVHNVNIYSSDYTSQYGSTYSYGSDLYRDDFECSSLSAKTSYYGKVSRITKNTIYVQESSGESSLYIASCTNFQTSTGYRYPRVGDRIAWRGYKRNVGRAYSVLEAMCY